MANVIEFNEFTASGNGAPGDLYCWLCQKAASARALFCHHCGTIQPVRMIDHFARLGLEPRVDVDIELLERQYTALRRTLDPARFALRGMGERGHATKQLEILDEAYETLRDPLRRGRYWLTLHGGPLDIITRTTPTVEALTGELREAAAPAECDRVAQKAGQALEEGIMGLLQALRGQNWQQAHATLAELEGLEALLGGVHARRAALTTSDESGGTLASVK